MVQKRISEILLFTLLFLNACGGNKFEVDTSKIDVRLDIKRLDKDLIANYPDSVDVYGLINKYGNFLELYSKFIIQAGAPSNKDFAKSIMDFNKYCSDFQIPEEVDKVFGDLNELKSNLTVAFKHYKYYFPDKQIPEIYTYLSNFNQSVVVDEGLLGIGLDKYLGVDRELYPTGTDWYKIRRMHKAMIPVDCMRLIAESDYPFKDSVNNMLNQMVYQGKIQYFLDAMLPAVPDTLKFGYTKDQLDWADYNEHKMWAYLVEHKMLFITNELEIKKMIGDAPFTSLFANNSAPRAGAFLGWKIVSRFMAKHPDISLSELMKNDDYQGILNAAAYKP